MSGLLHGAPESLADDFPRVGDQDEATGVGFLGKMPQLDSLRSVHPVRMMVLS